MSARMGRRDRMNSSSVGRWVGGSVAWYGLPTDRPADSTRQVTPQPLRDSRIWRQMARRVLTVGALAVAIVAGCGNPAFFNPAFINSSTGELFPLVPGPNTGLVLIRAVNNTSERLTFIITIERSTEVAAGDGAVGTITETETVELFTQPQALANEAGVLFECTAANPISRIGLGRNLNQPSDPGLFVGGLGDVIPGFGVSGNINPLSNDPPELTDFLCGDTVIFQAIQSIAAPGGFIVKPFVLQFESQPAETVRNTFRVAADFLGGRITEQ